MSLWIEAGVYYDSGSFARGLMTLTYVGSGFAVGLLVGLTGVGGGSLMTPLLTLLVRDQPGGRGRHRPRVRVRHQGRRHGRPSLQRQCALGHRPPPVPGRPARRRPQHAGPQVFRRAKQGNRPVHSLFDCHLGAADRGRHPVPRPHAGLDEQPPEPPVAGPHADRPPLLSPAQYSVHWLQYRPLAPERLAPLCWFCCIRA